MTYEKLPTRYDLWREWSGGFPAPWLHKFLVLIGIAESPAFEYYRRVRSASVYDEDLDELLEEGERIYGEDIE